MYLRNKSFSFWTIINVNMINDIFRVKGFAASSVNSAEILLQFVYLLMFFSMPVLSSVASKVSNVQNEITDHIIHRVFT